jgi:hypothetical protein
MHSRTRAKLIGILVASDSATPFPSKTKDLAAWLAAKDGRNISTRPARLRIFSGW